MLRSCSLGFGALALRGVLGAENQKSEIRNQKSSDARVKHVIFAYMSGGVSHVDSWDPKPELTKRPIQKRYGRASGMSGGYLHVKT